MVACAAREIGDGDVVFVGMRLPLLAFALAVSTHAPRAVGVFENGVMRDTPPRGPVVTMSDPPNLDGALWAGALSRAMALLAGGHVDLGFIGGAQIDRHANLNTTRIGPADAPRVRLPGSGGGCDIACAARRLLVVMPHEPRRFVERGRPPDQPRLRRRPRLARAGRAARLRVGHADHHQGGAARHRGHRRLRAGVGPPRRAGRRRGRRHPWGWPAGEPRAAPVTKAPDREVLEALRALDPERVWTGDG